MSDCNHMTGLHETGEDYVPVYASDPRQPDAPGYDYYFAFCPECGANLSAHHHSESND